MRLQILATGKARSGRRASLCGDYLKRLPYGGTLTEVGARIPDGPARQSSESQKILQQIPDRSPSKLVALDPSGKDTSSEELADLIGHWRDEGIATCFFAIGGADGHSDALLERADRTIAFGRAIWPHILFRVMLAEQLYRAEMILQNHPYHRG